MTAVFILGIAFALAFVVPACAAEPYSHETVLESCMLTSEKQFTVGAERGVVNYVEIKGRGVSYATEHHPELYLFELKAYQDEIYECDDYVAKVAWGRPIDIRLRLEDNTEDSRLFSSFVLARQYDGEFYPVSNRIFITNPEEIAGSNIPYNDPSSKKGLLVDFTMTDDAMDLGVSRVILNIDFAQFMGEGICYEYDGCTYEFSEGVVEEYDRVISAYSAEDIQITAVVLNGYNEAMPELHYDRIGLDKDMARIAGREQPVYYHFGTNTQAGMETTAALASFIAERYSGENRRYGRVSNWVIGNEINNPDRWNYMGEKDFDSYIREYARSFRVFYTAIRSKSANAKIFFSLDYDWVYDRDSGNDKKYSAKDVLDALNAQFRKNGNIDWNLAAHPYPSPPTDPVFWDDENASDDENTPVINFKNLDVLTEYMTKNVFLNAGGNVRSIILSEEGFTSVSKKSGECQKLQAAAFAYAYYIADSNKYIDAFILNRQVDAPIEMKEGLYLGLWSCGPGGDAQEKKYIWNVFRNIDNKDTTLEYTAFAKPIIGIRQWREVIPDFKYAGSEALH